MQAMILAAGFGTRLLPHTLIRPKPLFPILNQPLLLLTIERLQNLGFDHIVVNCHHLRQQIVTALRGLAGVVVQEEEVILGTGGGIRRARRLLRDEPVLVSNGDIYHTIDFLKLYNEHRNSGRAVTLAMHDYPRFNLATVIDGKVVNFSRTEKMAALAFSGLHVIEPTVLEDIEETGFSCIIEHYRKFIAQGGEIGSFRCDGCYWTDMGTAEDYLALHYGLLTETIPCWQEIGPIDMPYCLAQGAQLGTQVEMHGWASIGNANIGNKSYIERSVVWDDVQLPKGYRAVDSIISASVK